MPPEPTSDDRRSTERAAVSGRLHGLTVALCTVAIAAAAIGVCGADGFSPFDWGWLVAAVAVSAGAGSVGRRLALRSPIAAADWFGPLLLAVYAGNVAIEPLIRLGGGGRPLEIVLYVGMASLLPVLAFAASTRRWVPVAGLVSLAVTLFGVCLLSDPAVALVAAVWTALVPVWLVVLTDETTAGQRVAQHGCLSRRLSIAAAAGAFLLVGLAAASLDGRESLSFARGVLASSGGDGKESEYARNGVGDGRHLVPATTMAESFGPLDDAPFAKTDDPSLYDVLDERYDRSEVVKTSKNDRAVALDPQDVQQQEREMAEAEAAGRAFSTLRAPRDDRRGQVGDRPSDALFYVAGRVPLHLRTAVFERFDGVTWSRGEFSDRDLPTLTMRTLDEQPWLLLREQDDPAYRELDAVLAEAESHAIKPVHIREPTIPLPPSATAVHIRDVATETMFRPQPGGLVAMDRKRLPKMVPIHVASRRIDREQLSERATFYSGPHALHELPAGPRTNAIADVASRWVTGLERGWPQIAEIERRLRLHAVLDESAVADSTSTMPVADFVLGDRASRRGPDYLFATAAAVMLRSQGYATRLVAGYYARPTKYDAEGRHTAIHAGDLHTWCEVRLPGDVWVTIEATPGYEVLGPERSLWYRLTRTLASVPRRLWAVRWRLTLAAVVLLALFLARDRLRELAWQIALRLTGRDRDALAVWRLLDWRLARVRPAPTGWTLRRRVAGLSLPRDVHPSLQRLVNAVERGAFQPRRQEWDAVDGDDFRSLIAATSLSRLRETLRSGTPASSDESCESPRAGIVLPGRASTGSDMVDPGVTTERGSASESGSPKEVVL